MTNQLRAAESDSTKRPARGLDDFDMLPASMAFYRCHNSGLRRRPTWFGQTTAWFGVALVALLAWLAADPAAHDWFHQKAAQRGGCGHAGCTHGHGPLGEANAAGPAADGDHGCVVTDFATGATDVRQMALLMYFTLRLATRLAATVDDTPRARPFRHHAPTCGPPTRA